MRQTTCNWIKMIHVLDEATWMVNVILISWFFYLFLCSISLHVLVKYDFILRYEAWVNAIRASSFIENVPQISTKLIAFQRHLLGKLPQNRPFFTNRSKILAKSAVFPVNLSLKIQRNLTFFSVTYQKPCKPLEQGSTLEKNPWGQLAPKF